MIYSLPLPRKTPLRTIVLVLGFWAVVSAAPLHAAPAPKTGVTVQFVTPGTILPRRGHEVLTLESTNVERLSASILHVSEADTLRVLANPTGPIPKEAQEVWQSQITIKPNGAAPLPGQTVQSTLDVLQLIKPLQPGLYIATAHEVTTGAPRAEARKMFMISNIGLQAFAGVDGMAVQARLLSEANPAVNIDVALIAHNNREIARIRTDNDGIARFAQDQISGAGDDAPAAIFAYGADGEFTALPVSVPKSEPSSLATAMIITDRQAYKPGDRIRGLVLVRKTDGSGATGEPVFVELENSTGGVAEFQTATASDSSGFGLTMHAPPQAGKWMIRAYRNQDNHPILLGQAAITVSSADAIGSTALAAISIDKPNTITIAPGRRSFQPGEMANVSVQPPQDSLVTIALVDQSVHAIVRQKIGKDGAVVQLPIPADATGGMYVIASAFSAPVDASDKTPAIPLSRSFGLQWIDIDQGAKRMSVRLDTPERADFGAKLTVAVTLQDLNDKIGKVQLVGTDGAAPTALDPLAFFYGRHPVSVQVYDTYATLIGANQAPVPDFSTIDQSTKPSTLALLWPDPVTTSKAGKVDFTQIFPNLQGHDPRLRISAIAWSDDRLGYGEASISGVAGKKPVNQKSSAQAAPVHSRTVLLKPAQSLTLKSHEAIIASADPIVAIPDAYDGNKPLFATSDMPKFRDYMQDLLIPANDGTLLYDAILSLALPGQALDLPHVTRARLLDAVQSLLAKPGLSNDQIMLAHYVLLKSGRETTLEVAAWLAGNHTLTGLPAKAARLALATESPLFTIDIPTLQASIDDLKIKSDPDARAVTLCLLAQANQPWPAKLTQIVASEAAKSSSRTDLILRVAQGAHLNFAAAKLKFTGIDQPGNAAIAGATPVKVDNADSRTLHAAIVTGLPQ